MQRIFVTLHSKHNAQDTLLCLYFSETSYLILKQALFESVIYDQLSFFKNYILLCVPLCVCLYESVCVKACNYLVLYSAVRGQAEGVVFFFYHVCNSYFLDSRYPHLLSYLSNFSTTSSY